MTDTRNLTKGIAMIGLGALAMYWIDPAQGRRRRALALDQARGAWKRFGELAVKKSRHLRNRAHGVVAEASRLLHREPEDVVERRLH
jgi:hyperosmotically inducible periplasmic protein